MPDSRIRVDTPAPGEVIRTVAGGVPVAIWNVEGHLHALSDVCPHRGFVLSEGAVLRGRDGPLSIVCPGHNWRFDVDTGEAVFRPECLKVYRVESDKDGLWVVDPEDLPGCDREAPN
jgi:nitrite reductase (NADH) small subunit